jgi:hypothetical protein
MEQCVLGPEPAVHALNKGKTTGKVTNDSGAAALKLFNPPKPDRLTTLLEQVRR